MTCSRNSKTNIPPFTENDFSSGQRNSKVNIIQIMQLKGMSNKYKNNSNQRVSIEIQITISIFCKTFKFSSFKARINSPI